MSLNDADASDGDASAETRGESESVQYSWTDGTGETPSEAVVEAVADATGSDPTRMQPLYEVIDPDALNQLLDPRDDNQPAPSRALVSFHYAGCDVTVHADGGVAARLSDDHT